MGPPTTAFFEPLENGVGLAQKRRWGEGGEKVGWPCFLTPLPRNQRGKRALEASVLGALGWSGAEWRDYMRGAFGVGRYRQNIKKYRDTPRQHHQPF